MAECIGEGTLRAYTDGVLPPEQEAEVSTHLAHCDLCKSNLAELDVLTSEVASLVNDGAPLPDPGVALARLRSTLVKAAGNTLADAPPIAVSPASEPARFRAYSRTMPLHPVAIGVGLASVMVAVLLTFFLMNGQRQASFQPTKEFVPKGMVRHFTVSHTFTTTVEGTLEGQPYSTFIEEVWLTNGKNHLLRYSKAPSTNGESWTGGETWVEDDSVYFYNPSPKSEITVYKHPYDARHLELYVPNEISYLLTIPNAKITGDDVLDGRPVTVIEAIADKINPTPQVFTFPEGGVQAVTDYKLWVDKENSQVLQREHKTTFLDGSRKGKTQTQTFKVVANEVKDASQFPADLFTFKLPAGATVVEAASPFGPTPTPGIAQKSDFVPQGKVRYMKVARTWKSPGIENGRTDELWLGNGKEHLLLRTNTLHVDVSQHVREHGVMFTRVTDGAVYVYYKNGEDAYRHYKYPYDPRFIEPYVPQDINALLSLPNAQVVGDDRVNGRAVTLVEIPHPDINPLISLPNPNDPERSLTSVRLWVDKESSLIVKREDSIFYTSGPRSGTTETQTLQILENELRDRSTVTVDFFDYEPGGTIIESPTSPFAPDEIDAKKPTPTVLSELGKSIFTTRWNADKQARMVFPVDPETGKAVPGYEPIFVGAKTDFVGPLQLSPNGSRLIGIEARSTVSWPWGGGSSTRGSADVLHLIDVQAWREITTTLSTQQAAYLVAFSDDGKYLALDMRRYKYDPNRIADELVLVEAATGVIAARRELDIQPSHIEFSADGSKLVAYGQRFGTSPGTDKPDPLRVMLLERSTLKTIWEQSLDSIVGGYWCEWSCEGAYEQKVFASWDPAITFSPDRSKMYIVHANADKLTTIDFVVRQVRSVDIAEAKSWLETLLDLTASKAEAKGNVNGVEKLTILSADGEKLYVSGQKLSASSDVEAQSTELQVIEVKTGHKVAILESDLSELRVSSDGQQLFLLGSRNNRQVTDVLDAVTLKRITTIEDWRVTPLRRLDGQPILLASQREENNIQHGLMDSQTFKVTSTWPWSSLGNDNLAARR